MVMNASARLAVFRDIGLGVSIKPAITMSTANLFNPSAQTYWLASPSPSILGTYGAGISRR